MKLIKSKTLNGDEQETKNEHTYNFWEGQNYTSVLKRQENCSKISINLSNLFDELSKIESTHAANLSDWAYRYNKYIDTLDRDDDMQFSHFGSTKKALKNISEAIALYSSSRIEMWKEIQSGCVNPITTVNETVLNKVNNNVPELKSIREDMKTVNKTYCEALDNMKKARQAYMTYCVSIKPDYEFGDSVEIFKDLDIKKKEKWNKLLKRFEERKSTLSLLLAHYQESMTRACQTCDTNYTEYIHAIKDVIMNLRNTLSLENNKKHHDMLDSLERSSNLIDAEADIRDWACAFGPNVHFDHFKLDQPFKNRRKLIRSTTVRMNSPKTEKSPTIPTAVEKDVFENNSIEENTEVAHEEKSEN